MNTGVLLGKAKSLIKNLDIILTFAACDWVDGKGKKASKKVDKMIRKVKNNLLPLLDDISHYAWQDYMEGQERWEYLDSVTPQGGNK